MSELRSVHLDDFTLLRYVVGDLGEDSRLQVARHLEGCRTCLGARKELEELHQEMRRLDRESMRLEEAVSRELPEGDPFRVRPELPELPRGRGKGGVEFCMRALTASRGGGELREPILEASREPRRLKAVLAEMPLSEASERYGLLYALQESGRRIAESPVRSLLFGEEALARLRREPFTSGVERSETERMVPKLVLRAQAHLLAGQACIWTKDYERARSHLELAYRSFALGAGDEISLAIVEYHESQRRSFLHRGKEALALANRAAAMFEELGLEDLVARARVAQGLAYFELGRHEEAVAGFREALPVFEKEELWSNYVGALNNMGTCLAKLGRLDEARREYARALRRLSREEHRPFVAYVRHGLADVMFEAGRYREAAISLAQASRLYRESGLPASALTASLYEVESWARHGDLARARHRLDLFLAEVSRHRALDASVAREIGQALSGDHPDLERIAGLRRQTEGIFQERLGLASA